jgi:hypothetical protein
VSSVLIRGKVFDLSSICVHLRQIVSSTASQSKAPALQYSSLASHYSFLQYFVSFSLHLSPKCIT